MQIRLNKKWEKDMIQSVQMFTNRKVAIIILRFRGIHGKCAHTTCQNESSEKKRYCGRCKASSEMQSVLMKFIKNPEEKYEKLEKNYTKKQLKEAIKKSKINAKRGTKKKTQPVERLELKARPFQGESEIHFNVNNFRLHGRN